jgi:hypothetical protein
VRARESAREKGRKRERGSVHNTFIPCSSSAVFQGALSYQLPFLKTSPSQLISWSAETAWVELLYISKTEQSAACVSKYDVDTVHK